MKPKKIQFIIGDVTMTFTPEDIEAVWSDYERDNPGKSAMDMPAKEFTDRCMKKITDSARPTSPR